MIDYYETKTHPITKRMVLEAYKKVRSNGGCAGIDEQSLSDYAKHLQKNLYKLWNRMTSGSYMPSAVKQVMIPKSSGGERALGIPTVEDRIAQQVVKIYLEPAVDQTFHRDSYGYRPDRDAHQALISVERRCYKEYPWVIDIDIKSFFNSIDHELMMKAMEYYTKEKWVLLYVRRWLETGVMNDEQVVGKRLKGTPQGGVISPLLANIYLHFAFDKWMEKNHSYLRFERYCDDIIVHVRTERQAEFIKDKIAERLKQCKLQLNESKTQIVYCPNHNHLEKHRKVQFDFLGYTFRPRFCPYQDGWKLQFTRCMSKAAKKKVLMYIRWMQIKRHTGTIQQLAERLNPIIRGWINYYCKVNGKTTTYLWWALHLRIVEWVRNIKKIGKMRAVDWIKSVYAKQPGLFVHWSMVKP